MRVLFAGSSDIAVPSLEKAASGFELIGVLTNPDRTTGRGRKVLPNPVAAKAQELGLHLIQPETLRGGILSEIGELKADILAVFSYGRIFGPRFLSLFPMGGINVHPSLLPKYRGSSPVLTAILNGDSQTGITVQRINLEMDTGNILNQQIIPLKGNETTESLSSYISVAGGDLLIKTLNEIENNSISETVQSTEGVTYCSKISREDGRIDWNESSELIYRKIRAFTPWPRSFTVFSGKKLIILEGKPYRGKTELSGAPGTVLGFDKSEGILIQTGNGILAAATLQLQSKKANDWKSFLNGTKHFIGSVLGGE